MLRQPQASRWPAMIEVPVSNRPAIEPVLPLINVVFLLLIFFMVAGQFSGQSPQGIELADDAGDVRQTVAESVTLALHHNGELRNSEGLVLIDFAEPERLSASISLQGERIELMADRQLRGMHLRAAIRWLNGQGVEQVLLISKEVR